jgi:hypothetical protein
MTKPNTITAENVEAIWVNKSSKTGFQVMGCGSHFHGENMALYVSMDVLNAAIARAEQAEARVAELEAALRLADAALGGANMNMSVIERKIKVALSREGGE